MVVKIVKLMCNLCLHTAMLLAQLEVISLLVSN